MTAQEVALIAAEVAKDKRHEYAPSTDHYDSYGNSTDDHGHNFDSRHIEDVFPY